jgi:hypothetical protein
MHLRSKPSGGASLETLIQRTRYSVRNRKGRSALKRLLLQYNTSVSWRLTGYKEEGERLRLLKEERSSNPQL